MIDFNKKVSVGKTYHKTQVFGLYRKSSLKVSWYIKFLPDSISFEKYQSYEFNAIDAGFESNWRN